MSKADDARLFGARVLNRLMVGGCVCGMRFFTPQMLIDGPADPGGECFVNLTSEWIVVEGRPATFPKGIPETSQEDEEAAILGLRGLEVASVEISTPWPHLMIFFTDGRPESFGHKRYMACRRLPRRGRCRLGAGRSRKQSAAGLTDCPILTPAPGSRKPASPRRSRPSARSAARRR